MTFQGRTTIKIPVKLFNSSIIPRCFPLKNERYSYLFFGKNVILSCHFLKYLFFFRIVLNLPKSGKEDTEDSCIPHTQFPLLLLPYSIMVFLSQLKTQCWYIVIKTIPYLNFLRFDRPVSGSLQWYRINSFQLCLFDPF